MRMRQEIPLLPSPIHTHKDKARRPPTLGHNEIQHHRPRQKDQNQTLIIAHLLLDFLSQALGHQVTGLFLTKVHRQHTYIRTTQKQDTGEAHS